jgi:PleD family two-component response regulator
VLPHTDLAGAMLVAERLRAGVADLALTYRGAPVPITLTLGVATMVPGELVGQVISRPDAAWYQSKHARRDRGMASGQVTLPPTP